MIIITVQKAINELYEIYGFWGEIKNIYKDTITMANGDKWSIGGDGHIERI